MHTMPKKVKQKKKVTNHSGLFVPGCLFLGMGVGFLIDNLVGGLFIGLGAGFLLMVLYNDKK